MEYDMDFKKEKGATYDSGLTASGREKPFDYDAFLEDDLDARITDVLDGKDLLEPDAFGGAVSEYVPKRSADGRGRHEAPAPEGFVEEVLPRDETAIRPDSVYARQNNTARETAKQADSNEPRYAAPERPRVVVKEPKKVYIDPVAEEESYEYDADLDEDRRGRSEGVKWLIAALVSLVLIGTVAALFLKGPLRSAVSGFLHGTAASETAETTDPKKESDSWALPEQKTEPTAAPATPAVNHMITVTAGSGGSISPSGIVAVEEGASKTFTIAANEGYELSQLLVDGTSVDTVSEYTFSDVRGDHTIYAIFQESWAPEPEADYTQDLSPEQADPPGYGPGDEPEYGPGNESEQGFVSGLDTMFDDEPIPEFEPESDSWE